jgi:hypothetical protein
VLKGVYYVDKRGQWAGVLKRVILRRGKESMGRGVEKGYTASRKGVNGQGC